MVRSANAVWHGDLKSGTGKFTTQSGVLSDVNYSFKTRFENEPRPNPEEIIAAAHASCFAMATSGQLGERGIVPERLDSKSDVTMEGLKLTKSALTLKVLAPRADESKIREAAEAAKANCPISKVLNLEITLDLTVEV